MAYAIALHCLSAIIWVGGMFFAYLALRPAAVSILEPAPRLCLWQGVFQRFFPWVWFSVVTLLATGLWMIIQVFGGMANVGQHIHIMLTLGLIMMLIFGHVFFNPYKKLTRAVVQQNWTEAGTQLNKIRRLIAVNLVLGLIVVFYATYGRYA